MTKLLQALLCAALLAIPAAASAGTVTAVKASATTVAVAAPVSVTISGTNPCGAAFIDYGDGTAITYAITGLPTTQSHTYQKAGTYPIVAKGMGNCDGQATTRIEVTAPAAPPAPPRGPAITAVDVTPVPGVQREPMTIDVKGTGTCAFTASFGDGNQQEFNEALPHRFTHAYAVADTYVLVVAPAPPCSGKFAQQIQVAPRGGARVTGLTLDPPETEARKGIVIAVEGYGTCRYVIDYGDGNEETRAKPLPDRLHHVYGAPGSYRVTVTASGACEGQAAKSLQVREPGSR